MKKSLPLVSILTLAISDSFCTGALDDWKAFVGLQLMGLVVKSDTTLVASWRHQNAATLKIPNLVVSFESTSISADRCVFAFQNQWTPCQRAGTSRN